MTASESELALLTEQQFAEQMADRYRELLVRHAGMKHVQVDGQIVTYTDLEADYDFWSARAGQRQRVVGITIENA